MPHSARTPRLAFDTLDEVAVALRAHGGRFSTPQRKVLEVLFAADGPVSANHIARGDGSLEPLDLTSVYRTLERLELIGAVRHVHTGHGAGLYALAGPTDREYLVCEHCRKVSTVDAEILDSTRAEIRARLGYEARFSHFPIFGLCPDCVDQLRPGGTVSQNDEHTHGKTHAHEHAHGDVAHTHPHTNHDHDHVEHEHEHDHDDHVHSHPHVHEDGLVDQHQHQH